jgi:hypothetical protein
LGRLKIIVQLKIIAKKRWISRLNVVFYKLMFSNIICIAHIIKKMTIEDLDKPLIFTSYLHAIYKHMTKFRSFSKSSINYAACTIFFGITDLNKLKNGSISPS